MINQKTQDLVSATGMTILFICVIQCTMAILPGTGLWTQAATGSATLTAVALYVRYRARLDGLGSADLGLHLTAGGLTLGAITGFVERPLEQPLLDYLCRGITATEWELLRARTPFPVLSHPSTFIASLLSILFAAAAEELFFRGYLVARLRRTFGATSVLILSSALFAASHCLPLRLYPYYFLGGLIYGALRLATGSPWPALIAHTVCNLMAAWTASLS